jgi:cytochrome c553
MRISIYIFLAFLGIACKHEPILLPAAPKPYVPGFCDPDSVYFENSILPIFQSNCAQSGCHDDVTAEEGLRLNSYANIMATGEIEPGDPTKGDIVKKISESNTAEIMPPPPKAALTSTQIDLIKRWIAQGAKNNKCTPECDTNDYKYSTAISSLLSTSCIGCHGATSPSGAVYLNNYDSVKAYALNGRLPGAVKHLTGYSAMPQGGAKLSDCKIRTLEKWIAEGCPNN